jgi:hypothetical protein
MVTWFASLFVIQAYGRFWKSGIMYINILSPRLWKGEALNSKNFNMMQLLPYDNSRKAKKERLGT